LPRRPGLMNTDEAVLLLREAGLRVTPQRVAVLKALAAASHPTAEGILERILPEYPGTGLATVYNTLAALAARGRVLAIPSPEGRRYDLRTEAHQHVRCRRCGRVADLPEWPGEEWVRAVLPAGWSAEGWQVMVEGLCDACRRVAS
jgi:Fur family peroxide stress response transcriptional regulator